MATLSSVSIGTPGAATAQTVNTAGGPVQQITRDAPGQAATDNTWTVATTAATVIASDIAACARVGVWIYNGSAQATVYLSVSGTNPVVPAAGVTGNFSFPPLTPGASINLPPWAVNLNVRMIGSAASGTVYYTLATHA